MTGVMLSVCCLVFLCCISFEYFALFRQLKSAKVLEVQNIEEETMIYLFPA